MADPSKTESATPRRREEARKRGQVAKSSELNTAVGILGALLVMQFAGSHLFEQVAGTARYFWGELGRPELDLSIVERRSVEMGLGLLWIMAPVFLGVILVGLISNIAQIGMMFSPEVVSLKFENLDPARGFSRVFSRRAAIEFFKASLKILLVVLVAWWTLDRRLPELMSLMGMGSVKFWGEIGALSATLMLRVGLTLLGLAVFDYAYQRWEYEESIKMSKQEVKDEYKQLEGDPQVKARIRRLQQDAARRRMMAELPTADVVITNPTHLAVALRFDVDTMSEPLVIAKGARLIAQRIKEIAREHSIPVLENKPLARALYETTPVGAAVPSALFSAVAELLAFVYQQQGRLADVAARQRARYAAQGALVLSPSPGENRPS